MKMRDLGNALVWLGLTIGLPGIIFAMSAVKDSPEPTAPPHNPAKCAVCRHYRGTNNAPTPIQDENMILVSPGHPYLTDNSAADNDLIP
jgi:hypothetical protein